MKNRLITSLAGIALVATLGLGVPAQAQAGISLHFNSGYHHQPHRYKHHHYIKPYAYYPYRRPYYGFRQYDRPHSYNSYARCGNGRGAYTPRRHRYLDRHNEHRHERRHHRRFSD